MSIVSASKVLKFHEFPSGTLLHTYRPNTKSDDTIRSISWSKDGNWLALVPPTGQIEIICVRDQVKLIHRVEVIDEPTCVAFQNTTKKNLAIGTKSGHVLIYDIKARSVRKRHTAATTAITHVQFTVKDEHIIAAPATGDGLIYNNVTNILSSNFKIPMSQSINALRTNPIKRNYIAAGSSEGVVAVWDINVNKNKFSVGSHKAPVTAVAFSPINSDFLVSTGLDRQFCFYDIGAHKCIANIFVECSLASVDFSPDGRYIVVASQKGDVHVYDYRNIQLPVSTFVAQNSAVKHILFRKNQDLDNSGVGSAFENIKEDAATSFADSDSKNESFQMCMMAPENLEAGDVSVTASDATDSFIAAMSLNKDLTNNTAESIKPDTSLKATSMTKMYQSSKCTPIQQSKLIQERFSQVGKTSTPNLEINGETVLSPIVKLPVDQLQPNQNIENLENLLRTAVRDELKVTTDELKNGLAYELKYSTYRILDQVRQQHLDTLLYLVKDTIKTENTLNNLFNNFMCTECKTNAEENLLLKQKIAMLESQLAELKKNRLDA